VGREHERLELGHGPHAGGPRPTGEYGELADQLTDLDGAHHLVAFEQVRCALDDDEGLHGRGALAAQVCPWLDPDLRDVLGDAVQGVVGDADEGR
jgi:hypothetical protein